MRSHIRLSPPNRWATPVRSSQRPSGPERAARGVQRRAANRPSRASQAASPSGSAARTSRPGTSMRALVERHAGHEAERARRRAGGGEHDRACRCACGGDERALGRGGSGEARARLVPRPARAGPPAAGARASDRRRAVRVRSAPCPPRRGRIGGGDQRRCVRSARLIRSIARSGRKSEASLGIGGLQDPVDEAAPPRWRASATRQRARPMPGTRQRRGRRAADPPAGDGGRRRGQRIGVRPCASAAASGRRARLPRRRAGAGGWRPWSARADLADHRGEAAVAQPLLHHRQHLLVVAAFGIDQPVGRQPGQREAGREQVAPRRAPTAPVPSPRARASRAASGGEEQGRGGIVARRRASPAPPRAARRRPARRRPAGRRPPRARTAGTAAAGGAAGALDRAHLLAQGGEARVPEGT